MEVIGVFVKISFRSVFKRENGRRESREEFCYKGQLRNEFIIRRSGLRLFCFVEMEEIIVYLNVDKDNLVEREKLIMYEREGIIGRVIF